MCCACGAKAMTTGYDKVSFHRFPSIEKKQELHQMWVLNMQTIRKNFFPSKTSVLCSRHFLASDFKIGENVHRITLKGTAVPTVFEGITPLTNSNSEIGKSNIIFLSFFLLLVDYLITSICFIDTAQMYDNYVQELAEKKRLKQEQLYGAGDEIMQEVVQTIPLQEGQEVYEEVIDSKTGIIHQTKKIIMTTPGSQGMGVEVVGNLKTDESGSVIISEAAPVFAISVPAARVFEHARRKRQ